MLTESFVAATETVKPVTAHLPSTLKDVGVVVQELQPQSILRQGFKKSSVAQNCLAASKTHIFAAQAGKATVIVYNREKGNQEALVPFPQKVTSLVYSEIAALLIIGTQDGKLILWETATGRISTSAASHIDSVTHLVLSSDGSHVISGSRDSTVHIWSIRDLISIERQQESLGRIALRNEPLASFTQHRSAITSLGISNSLHESTAFVVSAAEDKSCYIWNFQSQQLLRTYLLNETPECIDLDPAGRAIYFGSRNGSIQHIDFFDSTAKSKASILSSSAATAANPVQLKATNSWQIPSDTNAGAANCIALSYDGTLILTGHASGQILRWEVAKKRLIGEVTSLTGQAVTNLQMLRPTGFQSPQKDFEVTIPAVVKPRLDLESDAGDQSSLLAIPEEYKLHTQVVHARHAQTEMSDLEAAFYSPDLPQSLIDDALQALMKSKALGSTAGQAHTNGHVPKSDAVKIDKMEKELATLRTQVAEHEKERSKSVERHMARVQKREALGLQKREAFFAAKKAGKNGDEAMKAFADQEHEIDAESDEDALR